MAKKEERRKYLGINLSKKVKDLYTENCKTRLKETGDDTKKWKICCACKTEELTLLKCLYYVEQSTDST